MTGLASTTAAAAEAPVVGREVGQLFPPIVLPSLDGKRTMALSEFRGKKVLLIEFASW
jgi:hypothetical protein